MQKTFTAAEKEILTMLGVEWVANYALRLDLDTIFADACLGQFSRVHQMGNRCDNAVLDAYLDASPEVRQRISEIGVAALSAASAASAEVARAEREAIEAKVAEVRAAGPQVGDRIRGCGSKKKTALGEGTVMEIIEQGYHTTYKVAFACGERYLSNGDFEKL